MSNTNVEPPPEAAALFRMTFGFVASQALYVAAELGLADHLAHGPLTAHDLANKTSAHADALPRLLRVLVVFGVLQCDEQHRFSLTSTGAFLRTGVSGSLRATIRFLTGPWYWRAWEHLLHSVRTGTPAFNHAWGMSNFEYWERHAEVSVIHDDAMAGVTALETVRVLTAYDFSLFGTIVDVGGGNGALLAAILREYPQSRGILADLSHVVTQAAETLQQAGVSVRCQVIGGDFFETVPPGGDLYLLKHIIHDWDDARAGKILQHCHDAMSAAATLLITDCVLPHQPTPEAAMGYFVDMAMLVGAPGSRERTEEEFRQLLASVGFTLTRIIRAGGLADMIEARKR